MVKNACKDCEHLIFEGWDGNGKANGKKSICREKPEFHPVMGHGMGYRLCIYKNEYGDCPGFGQKEINDGKTKTKYRPGSKTCRETKTKEKTWRNGWGLLHKHGV